MSMKSVVSESMIVQMIMFVWRSLDQPILMGEDYDDFADHGKDDRLF